MSRVIKVIGTIDEEAFRQFCVKMDALETVSTSRGTIASLAPITIELSSGGGVAYDALAFSARIRLSPCKVKVIAYGYVASAAVLILANASHRCMTKEAWVMVHEDSGKAKGNVVEMEREVGQFRRMEDQWAELLAQRTKTTAKHWSDMHKKTTYLNAEECLALGLVDEVI